LRTAAYPIDPSGDGGTGSNEPAVWLGVASDVGADGSLASAYPTAWATTRRPQWGMKDINTSDYGYGADQLFSADCFGHPAQSGDPEMCPFPVDAAHAATLFNRVGALWKAAFAFAHAVGVKTCLGTESPMSPPPPEGGLAPLNMYYSATRGDHFATTTDCAECDGAGYVFLGVAASVLAQAAPGAVALSTYYNGAIEDNMLVADGQAVPPGYSLVRVEGYAMPAGGGNASLVDLLQFSTQTPKADHWAAARGSALAANATAAGYVSAGVIAQVWPASAAPPPSSQDLYEGALTRLKRLLGDTLDYYWIWTPEAWEWNHVDINNSLVQDVVKDAQYLQAARDAVYPSLNLASCGWVVGPAGFRAYFDSVLPPGWSMSSIDQEVGNSPVDPACECSCGNPRLQQQPLTCLPFLLPHSAQTRTSRNTRTSGECPLRERGPYPRAPALPHARARALTVSCAPRIQLHRVIPWMEDDPLVPQPTLQPFLLFQHLTRIPPPPRTPNPSQHRGLTSPELWVNRTLLHAIDARTYKATGLLGIHWRTRAVSPQVAAMHAFSWDPERDSVAFWREWALAQFGPSASPGAAAVFTSVDSFDTPRPVNWVSGPGTLTSSAGQCAAVSGPTYAFVDAFAQLRALVALDIANGDADLSNLERFDYWLSSFDYMRGIARFECDWSAYDAELAAVQKIADRGAQIAAAQGPLMAARASLVANASRMMWAHLARVSSLGDLGTITNVLSQSVSNVLGDGATSTLLQLANLTALPDGAAVPRVYDPAGAPLLRVNVVRGILGAGEPFRVEAFVLASAAQAAGAALTLFTAPAGGSSWAPTPMARVAPGRAVFAATVSGAAVADDFMYYIAATLPSATLVFPPTAPDSPQFVAVL
jgi:hypothetical protein